MNFVLGIAIGLIAGGVIGYVARLKNASAPAISGTDHLSESKKEKEENLRKLREFIATTDKRITNDLIQAELGISDATATRYLDELEKEGVLTQVGKEGKHVYYVKN